MPLAVDFNKDEEVSIEVVGRGNASEFVWFDDEGEVIVIEPKVTVRGTFIIEVTLTDNSTS